MEGFVFTDKLPVEDYLRLRAEAGWKVLPPDQAQAGLERSFANIAVVYDGEVVGMARIVWDHGYCAFLTDVIVTEKHRHNGLASEMIRRLTEKIRAEKNDGWQIAASALNTHSDVLRVHRKDNADGLRLLQKGI